MSQSPAGPYKPCPCGSGAKYKFCCRDKDRESEPVQSGPAEFTRERFDQLAKEVGIKEKLGELGGMARQMHENQRTRKTRQLTQMETQVAPDLPAAAVELAGAYPKPELVRIGGGLLRRGEPITRETIARVKEAPGWRDGERPQKLIEETFVPLLVGWEKHLVGMLKLPGKEVSSWRPVLENFILGYLVAYEGKLATDMGGKAHVIASTWGISILGSSWTVISKASIRLSRGWLPFMSTSTTSA